MISSACNQKNQTEREIEGADAQNYDVSRAMSESSNKGFKRAYGDNVITFPEDFGPHPAYRTEWWYYTGNLETTTGRPFGFELTIFRNGLVPPSRNRDKASSRWKASNMYMGHFAVSDIKRERFYSFERYSRGAAGLAGAQTEPFSVWLENWKITAADSNNRGDVPNMILSAQAGEVQLNIELSSSKPPVLQGDEGWDRKGPQKGNASYYFSLTRLDTEGTLQIKGKSFEVSGWSWMDREWSTSALGKNQEGWDWFAIQLSNNVEIMYYRLRNKDGSSSPYSKGVIVDKKGHKTPFSVDQVKLKPQKYWTSPTTGARYPIQWRMEIPRHSVSLSIIPKMENQELQTQFKYWEGAVRTEGTFADTAVTGQGYVELTGY